VALLNSVTLAASAVGAAVFGRIADLLGRKKIYSVEMIVLAVGALASACAPNFTFLLISRMVLGLGIGGDYPVSATIMSEYAGRRSRGRLVGLVFAMQGAGLVSGPLIAAVLLSTGMSHAVIWRVLLGLGAVPGLAVIYLRSQIHETPRFALAHGETAEAQAAIADAAGGSLAATGAPPTEAPAEEAPPIHWQGFALGEARALFDNPLLVRWLLGTTIGWALLGFAYYGNTISSPAVLKIINPNGTIVANTWLQLAIFVVFAVPGYWLAVRYLDRIGQRTIQAGGFTMMAVAFLLIGFLPGATTDVALFVALFGMSYLFTEFAPNVTTFVYPAEVFPVATIALLLETKGLTLEQIEHQAEHPR
jgi:MFS family permease